MGYAPIKVIDTNAVFDGYWHSDLPCIHTVDAASLFEDPIAKSNGSHCGLDGLEQVDPSAGEELTPEGPGEPLP